MRRFRIVFATLKILADMLNLGVESVFGDYLSSRCTDLDIQTEGERPLRNIWIE